MRFWYLLWIIGLARCAASPVEDTSVNLALRRTAHYLLRASGDSVSRIEPVKRIDKSTWQIQIPRGFDYEYLPAILSESMRVYRITAPYDVGVWDCNATALQLGYNSIDYLQNQEAPCGSRDMEAGCYQIQVTLQQAPIASGYALGGGVLFGLAVVAMWFWVGKKPNPTPLPEVQAGVMIGNTRLDKNNLQLTVQERIIQLTYREAKLLSFLADHPHQILERGAILKAVWEDEGLIVGRSLDVFISRLRKYLQDSNVVITTIHGIGYRFEVLEKV
jgi:hypothetical protein